MADYNLSGLSTRSFEQLIQAIAAKVIGHGIVIFGDGPDGGREATFEGTISYPSTEYRWNGYGIVQAKFKQRLQDSQKDGDWALDQLRSELIAFADPTKRRRKPEYYIFATNVVLTPVHEHGSKDRAFAIFEEFKNAVPLKGYDIWDYDKIRVFLDNSEEIRHSYDAWITPGDVLAQVVKRLQAHSSDFDQVLTNFLQKELLADQFVNLEQAGHSADEPIPLARVFVDLPISDRRMIDPPDHDAKAQKQLGFIAATLEIAKDRLDSEAARIRSGRVDLLRAPSNPEPGRYVLIGGPGQGKTTVGQFLCQLFRTAILKERPSSSLEPEVLQTLNTIDSQCVSEGVSLPEVRRFPIRIVLNEFAKALVSESEKHINSLLSYIVDRIRKKTNREVLLDDFRQWLRAYPWLIVLDGLDEVPSSSNRNDVLNAVRDFWIDATESNADVLVLATTRPQGYNEDFSPNIYHHKWLVPLSPEWAMHYAQRLVDVRYKGDEDRKQRILTRLERASMHEATARLMRSPLQVTIMTTLVDRMGQPPQERYNLFKAYYNVIYQREVERDIPAASILRDYKPDIDTIHHRVGLLLQIESERSGRTDAHLPASTFTEVVASRLLEEGHEGELRAALANQITEAATDRLVFIVGLKADEVGFEIRSLQEFMAAEGLMDSSDDIVRKRLQEIAPIAHWRNVFLFSAGKCFAERQHLRDTIHTICASLNEIGADEIYHTLLAGSQLALDLLEDGPARQQPKYARVLARLALHLLDLPPTDYHVRLAELYDLKLEGVYYEEIERRLAHNNHKKRLGGWACLFSLIESKLRWAEQMALSYWPSTENENLDLIKILPYNLDNTFLLSKVYDLIPILSPADLEGEMPYLEDNDSSAPSWFRGAHALLNVEGPDPSDLDVSLRLPDITEERIPLTLISIQGEVSTDLIPLKDLQYVNPKWGPFVATARFADDISKETLAEVLETIIPQFDHVPRWFVFASPWPLGACLAACKNQSDIKSLANQVKAGRLGDTKDWEDAEKRWGDRGVTIDDIFYMTDERWPFDQHIARAGFPFIVSNYSVYTSAEGVTGLKSILKIYDQLEESNIRAKMADIALSLTAYTHEGETVTLSFDQLSEIVRDLGSVDI